MESARQSGKRGGRRLFEKDTVGLEMRGCGRPCRAGKAGGEPGKGGGVGRGFVEMAVASQCRVPFRHGGRLMCGWTVKGTFDWLTTGHTEHDAGPGEW